jgi:hypothetical protein
LLRLAENSGKTSVLSAFAQQKQDEKASKTGQIHRSRHGLTYEAETPS